MIKPGLPVVIIEENKTTKPNPRDATKFLDYLFIGGLAIIFAFYLLRAYVISKRKGGRE